MKIAVLLANGFEEVEALAPIDLLKRSGFEVDIISIDTLEVTGAHGIKIIADKLALDVNPKSYHGLILPGGMPGADNLDKSGYTDAFIEAVTDNDGHIAAICAAPMILGKRGLLSGKNATCFPGFEKYLAGATYLMLDVVTDGNITTGSGMIAAMEFGKELVRIFSSEKFKKICDFETKKARFLEEIKAITDKASELADNNKEQKYNGYFNQNKFEQLGRRKVLFHMIAPFVSAFLSV